MPTYTFRCPKCKHEFTDIFLMKDSEGKSLICPKCGNKGLSRVFKGSFSIVTRGKSSSCPTGTCPFARKEN